MTSKSSKPTSDPSRKKPAGTGTQKNSKGQKPKAETPPNKPTGQKPSGKTPQGKPNGQKKPTKQAAQDGPNAQKTSTKAGQKKAPESSMQRRPVVDSEATTRAATKKTSTPPTPAVTPESEPDRDLFASPPVLLDLDFQPPNKKAPISPRKPAEAEPARRIDPDREATSRRSTETPRTANPPGGRAPQQRSSTATLTRTPGPSAPSRPADSSTTSADEERAGMDLQDALLDIAPILVATVAAGMSLLRTVSPTGIRFWDALLVIGFVALVTTAAPYASKFALLALAVPPFILLGFQAWWIVACMALGAAAVQDWRELRPDIARAIAAAIGAISILGLLRLPEVFGISRLNAVITVIAVLPTLRSALLALDTRQRLRLRACVLAAGALCFVGSVVALGSVLNGRAAAEAGVQRANDGLDLARAGQQDAAIAQLEIATTHFADAESSFSAWWAKPARLVPIIAQNHRATTTAAAQGRALTGAAIAAASTADIEQVRGVGGRVDLTLLQSLSTELDRTEATLRNASNQLATSRSVWLLPPVGNGINEALELVNDGTGDVALAAEAARVIPNILGASGERVYLVMFTNPAEPREFGGFASAFAFISANNGQVSVIDAGYGGDLNGPEDFVIPPPGFSEPESFPTTYLNYGRDGLINYFGNLMGTIDFPTIARAAREAMPIKGHPEIDGVMIVDPHALAAMMELADLEVVVPETQAVLNKDTLAEYIMIDQYTNTDGTGIGEFNRIDDRTEALVGVGEQIFSSLLSGELPGPERLGSVLGPVARAKRLQFTTFEESEHRLLQALFLRSTHPQPPDTVDFIHFTTDTAIPNKLEPYIERDVSYNVNYEPATGRFFSELAITLTNTSPEGLPEYVQGTPGDYQGLVPGTHRSRVSAWSNQGITEAFIDGVRVEDQERYLEYGRFRTLAFVEIPRGESRTVTMKLDGALAPGRYEVLFGSQPLKDVTTVNLNVSANNEFVEASTGNQSFSVPVELTEDVRFALDFKRP